MSEFQEVRFPVVKAEVLAVPELAGMRSADDKYVVARLTGDTSVRLGEKGDLILCSSHANVGAEIAVNAEQCHVLPPGVEPQTALCAVPIALALWVWGGLRLELGEIAACTGAHWLGHLLAQVAIWRGARNVVMVAEDAPYKANGVIYLDGTNDPAMLVKQLSTLLENAPGVAVVELSGRAETVDVVLESLPRWGRLMLAGDSAERLTIDFYNNIHRKGVVVNSVLLRPSLLFFGSAADRPSKCLRQAIAMLNHRDFGLVCRGASHANSVARVALTDWAQDAMGVLVINGDLPAEEV